MNKALWRLLVVCAWLRASAAFGGTFTLAVVPQFPAAEIHAAWAPAMQVLEKASGHRFELEIPPSITAMEAAFEAGRYDFVFVNPYHAVMARRSQQYVPLVRAGNVSLTGVLVVRTDSPYRTVEDLAGQSIAFPAPNAFGASLYLRALLAEKFRLDFRPDYLRTHSNAYRAVLLGQAAAAGGLRSTLAREPAELQKNLRIVYETPSAAPHPLAAHPRVPEKVREQVIAAIFDLNLAPAGRAMLSAMQMESPVRADYARDYRPIERLGLDRHAVVAR